MIIDNKQYKFSDLRIKAEEINEDTKFKVIKLPIFLSGKCKSDNNIDILDIHDYATTDEFLKLCQFIFEHKDEDNINELPIDINKWLVASGSLISSVLVDKSLVKKYFFGKTLKLLVNFNKIYLPSFMKAKHNFEEAEGKLILMTKDVYTSETYKVLCEYPYSFYKLSNINIIDKDYITTPVIDYVIIGDYTRCDDLFCNKNIVSLINECRNIKREKTIYSLSYKLYTSCPNIVVSDYNMEECNDIIKALCLGTDNIIITDEFKDIKFPIMYSSTREKIKHLEEKILSAMIRTNSCNIEELTDGHVDLYYNY